MLEANVKIISSLKTFLFNIATESDIRSFFTTKSVYFSRKRKLTFEHIVLFILRLNKKTLSTDLENYFEELKSKLTCTVSAFTLQRVKLEPLFFRIWNDVLCVNYYSVLSGKVKRWRGFFVYACDGSSLTLTNRPDLQAYFGGQKVPGGYKVIAKTFYCFDVLNKLVIHSAINPYRYSEFQMACDFINSGRLKSDYLMIFDRFYSAYNIVALFRYTEQNVNFVIRTNTNYNYVKTFLKSRKNSMIIDLYPTINSRKHLLKMGYKVRNCDSIKVRLIRVELPGKKVEVLMTSLLNEETYRYQEFKKLYAMRWGVETNIDFQKNKLQLESMSGASVITIEQDFYATVITTNLHFLIVAPAQEIIDKTITNKKYPMKINMNKAAGKIKSLMIQLFKTETLKKVLLEILSYVQKYLLPIRNGRSFPRIRKNQNSRSKHRTFTNYKPAY